MRAQNKATIMDVCVGVLILCLAACREIDDVATARPSWEQGCFKVSVAPAFPLNPTRNDASNLNGPRTLHLSVSLGLAGRCLERQDPAVIDVVMGHGVKPHEADDRINRFDFGMRNNFWLVGPQGRIHPVLYHMERTFGMEPGRNFLLHFRIDEATEKWIRNGSGVDFAFEIPVRGASVATLRLPSDGLIQQLQRRKS